MFYLCMLILAACAVRCDDSSYYVIQVQEDDVPNEMRPAKPFKVYWNVPTMQCSSKKIFFEDLHQRYGIIQNENDHFRGDKIAILYDPGIFPALLKNETSGDLIFRNGGVPQEGDLERHLVAFAKFVEQSVLKDFSGVGIIDFESWRPIYRQNFGVLTPYKEVSYEIERTRHWWWTKSWLQAEAMARFEKAGKKFMHKTLILAKQLRPNALWGYYAYPYCFNMAGNHFTESCAKNVPQENDRLSWLWSSTTALYPSVYGSKDLSTQQLQQMIRGRIKEAHRTNVNNSPILPYFWFKYRDGGFLSQKDLVGALETLYRSSASGFIMWGSSNDVNTKEKCQNLLNYLNSTLGPAVANYTKRNRVPLQDDGDNTENYDTVLNTNSTTIINQNTTESIPDPELDWDPPENYTQYITQSVQIEFINNDNSTTRPSQLSNESETLDRRKSENDSLNPLNPITVNVTREEIYLPNMLEENSDSNNIDEVKSNSNLDYSYVVNNHFNCTRIDDVNSFNVCDNYSNSTTKSVFESDINVVESISTKNGTIKIKENDVVLTTEISLQLTNNSNRLEDVFNNSVVSQNDLNTNFSFYPENKETNNSFMRSEIKNNLISKYNMTHKDKKKGYSIKTKVKESHVSMDNVEDINYAHANHESTLSSGDVLSEIDLLTESDGTFLPTTEIYLEHKNSLRHSKNKKKGRRKNLMYHTTENIIPQDESSIHSKSINPLNTTEVRPDPLPKNETSRPPIAYELRGTKNMKKGYKNIETYMEQGTDEAVLSQKLNFVNNKQKLTKNSEMLIDRDFTTDQVAGSSTTIFHVFGYTFHVCCFFSVLTLCHQSV